MGESRTSGTPPWTAGERLIAPEARSTNGGRRPGRHPRWLRSRSSSSTAATAAAPLSGRPRSSAQVSIQCGAHGHGLSLASGTALELERARHVAKLPVSSRLPVAGRAAAHVKIRVARRHSTRATRHSVWRALPRGDARGQALLRDELVAQRARAAAAGGRALLCPPRRAGYNS